MLNCTSLHWLGRVCLQAANRMWFAFSEGRGCGGTVASWECSCCFLLELPRNSQINKWLKQMSESIHIYCQGYRPSALKSWVFVIWGYGRSSWENLAVMIVLCLSLLSYLVHFGKMTHEWVWPLSYKLVLNGGHKPANVSVFVSASRWRLTS